MKEKKRSNAWKAVHREKSCVKANQVQPYRLRQSVEDSLSEGILSYVEYAPRLLMELSSSQFKLPKLNFIIFCLFALFVLLSFLQLFRYTFSCLAKHSISLIISKYDQTHSETITAHSAMRYTCLVRNEGHIPRSGSATFIYGRNIIGEAGRA